MTNDQELDANRGYSNGIQMVMLRFMTLVVPALNNRYAANRKTLQDMEVNVQPTQLLIAARRPVRPPESDPTQDDTVQP